MAHRYALIDTNRNGGRERVRGGVSLGKGDTPPSREVLGMSRCFRSVLYWRALVIYNASSISLTLEVVDLFQPVAQFSGYDEAGTVSPTSFYTTSSDVLKHDSVFPAFFHRVT